ncbi:hypothetical protein AB7M17_008035 [Bradyrhizobium sp. USDA 377]
MAQMKWTSLRYDLARAITPATGVKRYFFVVYQNEPYSKLAERRGRGRQPCVDRVGQPDSEILF